MNHSFVLLPSELLNESEQYLPVRTLCVSTCMFRVQLKIKGFLIKFRVYLAERIDALFKVGSVD